MKAPVSFLNHSSRLSVTNVEKPQTFLGPSIEGCCRGPIPIRDPARSPHSTVTVPMSSPAKTYHCRVRPLPVSLPPTAFPGHGSGPGVPSWRKPPLSKPPPSQQGTPPPLPCSLSSQFPFAALRPCYLWTVSALLLRAVSLWKQGWTHYWQPGLLPGPPHQPHPQPPDLGWLHALCPLV